MVLAVLVDVGRFGKSIEAALGSTDAAPLTTLKQMEAMSAVWRMAKGLVSFLSETERIFNVTYLGSI